jgi:hypothetical protein
MGFQGPLLKIIVLKNQQNNLKNQQNNLKNNKNIYLMGSFNLKLRACGPA